MKKKKKKILNQFYFLKIPPFIIPRNILSPLETQPLNSRKSNENSFPCSREVASHSINVRHRVKGHGNRRWSQPGRGIGERRIDPNRITPTRGGLYPSHEIGRGQRTYRQSLKAHWSVRGRGEGPSPSVKSIRRTLGTVRTPSSSFQLRFNLPGEHSRSSKELSFSLDRSKLFERRIL